MKLTLNKKKKGFEHRRNNMSLVLSWDSLPFRCKLLDLLIKRTD